MLECKYVSQPFTVEILYLQIIYCKFTVLYRLPKLPVHYCTCKDLQQFFRVQKYLYLDSSNGVVHLCIL